MTDLMTIILKFIKSKTIITVLLVFLKVIDEYKGVNKIQRSIWAFFILIVYLLLKSLNLLFCYG